MLKSLLLLVCISFVIQLLPSSFLSAAWASPCHRATISRFKIGFELIKVRVKWVAFTLWMGKM